MHKEDGQEELQRVSFDTTIHKTKQVNKGDNHDESHDDTASKESFLLFYPQSRTKKVPHIRLL